MWQPMCRWSQLRQRRLRECELHRQYLSGRVRRYYVRRSALRDLRLKVRTNTGIPLHRRKVLMPCLDKRLRGTVRRFGTRPEQLWQVRHRMRTTRKMQRRRLHLHESLARPLRQLYGRQARPPQLWRVQNRLSSRRKMLQRKLPQLTDHAQQSCCE